MVVFPTLSNTKANFFVQLLFVVMVNIISYRRTNELKLDTNIPDDIVMKFKQFWLDFRDAPLKGNIF